MAFPSSPSTNQVYNDGVGNWIYVNATWVPYIPSTLQTVLITGSIKGGSAALAPATVIITGTKVTGQVVSLKEPTAIIPSTGLMDLSKATDFYYTVTANIALKPINYATAGLRSSFSIELTNGGAFTITWWAGLTWNKGTAPTLSNPGLDVLVFRTRDGGVTWTGFVAGLAMA